MKPHTARAFSVLVAGCSLAIGCGAAPESTGMGGPGPQAGVFGTVLYEKSVGPDHVVDLYEFDWGVVAIHESLSIDNGEAPVMDGSWTFDSLADVYRKLNPGSGATPSAILEADGRRVQLRDVVRSIQTQTAGEVDHRLLLIQLAEHLRGCLKRRPEDVLCASPHPNVAGT